MSEQVFTAVYSTSAQKDVEWPSRRFRSCWAPRVRAGEGGGRGTALTPLAHVRIISHTPFCPVHTLPLAKHTHAIARSGGHQFGHSQFNAPSRVFERGKGTRTLKPHLHQALHFSGRHPGFHFFDWLPAITHPATLTPATI